MYTIMRKCSGYRLEHFFQDSFMASQYFMLVDCILKERDLEEQAHKKANKGNKSSKK